MPIPPRSPVTRDIIDKLALVASAGPFAEETSDSRLGLQSGLLGAAQVTRKWRVYCANPGDNPIVVMETLSTNNGGVRRGDPFPTTGGWGDGSYVLLHFTIIDHWIGTAVWTLLGTYVPSYIAALQTELWSVRIRSSLESERVFTDLDGKGIGTPKYVDISTPGVPTPSRLFAAKNIDGTVRLLQLADGGATPSATLPRYMTGADVPLRTSTLVLSKTFPDLRSRLPAIHDAVNLKKNINNDLFSTNTVHGNIVWVGSNPAPFEGTVLFSDFDLDEIPNPGGGPHPSIRITLTFKINPDGWQHKLYHTFKFDGGEESLIRFDGSTGDPVRETFKISGETSLTTLVENFG